MASPRAALDRLESLKTSFGADAARDKVAFLRTLARRRLQSAGEVHRLHELLCFWRAYPDDATVLARVEEMLAAFERRGDLRAHRDELADSGIAGTETHYSFYWPTARWLAERWPERLHVDWQGFEGQDELSRVLHLLVPYGVTPALDLMDLPARQWIDRLRAPDETDAAFLVRRFAALEADSHTRETLFESLDVPMRVAPGATTPARGRDRAAAGRPVFQRRPLSRERPDLRREIRRPPVSVKPVSRRRGRALIDLARASMVSRSRDLDAFAYGDPDDVRLVDCGEGLQFAAIGLVPERRLMFEAVYGYLTLKNGVPIGYVLSSALLRSAEIAYNVFDTYRGAEAAPVFGRVLAMVRHLFGAEAFSIDPYQLGYGNAEGLESGAWWFYYKLGFRPENRAIARLAAAEVAKIRRDPGHRSSPEVLEELASDYVYLRSGRRRGPIMGGLDLSGAGLAVAGRVAPSFAAGRGAGAGTDLREAMKLLGVRPRGLTPGERLAWQRWSPLVLSLPGVERWSPKEKRALAEVVRAKGGRRDSDFVARFDRHPKLPRAVLRLAGLA